MTYCRFAFQLLAKPQMERLKIKRAAEAALSINVFLAVTVKCAQVE